MPTNSALQKIPEENPSGSQRDYKHIRKVTEQNKSLLISSQANKK